MYDDEIVAEFQEFAGRVVDRINELLEQKTYVFAEELLSDALEEFGAATVENNVPCLCARGFHVSRDTKEIQIIVDELRSAGDDTYEYAGYDMRISLDEVYGEEIYSKFEGVVLPFDFLSTNAPKKYTEIDEDHKYVVDVMSRCISIYQALITTSKWILSDHLDSTKKLGLLRQAYRANVDDGFGKILALVIDYHPRYHIDIIEMNGGVAFVGNMNPIDAALYSSGSTDMEPWSLFNDTNYHLSYINIKGVDRIFCDPFMSTGSSWEFNLDMLKLLDNPERVVEEWPTKRNGEPRSIADATEDASRTKELIGKCPAIAHILDEIMKP